MFEAVPGQPRTWSAGSVPASAGEAAEGDEPDERDDQPEPEAPDDHHHDSNDDEDAADADPTHCELLDPTLIADIATFSQATAGAGEFGGRLWRRPPATRNPERSGRATIAGFSRSLGSALVNPVLRDDIVALRPWRDADIPAKFRAFSDVETQRFSWPETQPYTEQDAWATHRVHQHAWADGTGAEFACVDPRDD